MSAEEITRHPRKDNPVTVRIHHGGGVVTERHTDGKVIQKEESCRPADQPIGNPKEGQ